MIQKLLGNIHKFREEIEKLDMDESEFLENNRDEIIEMFETGSVTIVLSGKEVVLSLNIEGL
jgi:hypothetical protein